MFIIRIAAFLYSFGIYALSTIFLGFGCHKMKEKSSVDFTDVKKCVSLPPGKWCVCVCVHMQLPPLIIIEGQSIVFCRTRWGNWANCVFGYLCLEAISQN